MKATNDGVDGDDLGHVHDLVGVGFGPANLALAIAIEENAPSLDAVFVERQHHFHWHPGMLLDGARMQVAFPKDLATFRNPTSSYSFFNYLFEHGRLVDFVNHQTFFPTRHEFNHYLTWAAERVAADVRYATEVVDVTAVDGGNLLRVRCDDGTTLLARNIVVGAGLRERIPSWAERSDRVFHNHGFLRHLESMPPQAHGRFVVLGAGQSAAEVVQYLHSRYPDSEVHSVFSRYGYSPADNSPYANRIFDPGTVDELHRAPDQERARLLDLHRNTNYSVVDIDLINELYETEYCERVRGVRRLFMRRASEIDSVVDTPQGVTVTVRDRIDDHLTTLECDALVLATGFAAAPLRPLLGALAPSDGARPPVTRDYRLVTDPAVSAGIYLQGGTEATHGVTSSLLSNVAVRAGEILESLLTRTPAGHRRTELTGSVLQS
ncbi:lysine N(6)-hydroxylase/L-ornithine N(5)-oxygenase family protein [Rhodococcus gannanensis]|uniref:L-lysine N6-monooxygenase MbtG n=1 Tax=Rhodococcus gannanensis TaxID=1960308 RepID=A0ABW4PCS3_9NOCA